MSGFQSFVSLSKSRTTNIHYIDILTSENIELMVLLAHLNFSFWHGIFFLLSVCLFCHYLPPIINLFIYFCSINSVFREGTPSSSSYQTKGTRMNENTEELWHLCAFLGLRYSHFHKCSVCKLVHSLPDFVPQTQHYNGREETNSVCDDTCTNSLDLLIGCVPSLFK